jgi:hypothetical protein
MIKELSISGGGVRGIAFLGALYELQNQGKLDELEKIYACSIGTLLAICVIEKKDLKQLLDFIFEYNLKDLTDYSSNLETKSYLQGKKIEELFQSILGKDTCDKTLQELYTQHKIDLYITVYCLTTESVEYLHYTSFPELTVLKGVQMSCAIPILLPSVFYENKWYIDGAVMDNSPILSPNVTLLKAVSCPIDDEDEFEIGCVSDYKHSLYQYLNKLRKLCIKYKFKTFKIKPNRMIEIPVYAIKSTSFHLTKDDKFQLIMNGIKTANEFIHSYSSTSS